MPHELIAWGCTEPKSPCSPFLQGNSFVQLRSWLSSSLSSEFRLSLGCLELVAPASSALSAQSTCPVSSLIFYLVLLLCLPQVPVGWIVSPFSCLCICPVFTWHGREFQTQLCASPLTQQGPFLLSLPLLELSPSLSLSSPACLAVVLSGFWDSLCPALFYGCAIHPHLLGVLMLLL